MTIRLVSLAATGIIGLVSVITAAAGYRTNSGPQGPYIQPAPQVGRYEDGIDSAVNAGENDTAHTSEDPGDTEDPGPAETYYIAREHEGRIGIFYGGYTDQPFIVWDIDLDMLPDEDRTQFENGVRLESYEDVLMLYEDYSS